MKNEQSLDGFNFSSALENLEPPERFGFFEEASLGEGHDQPELTKVPSNVVQKIPI